MQRQWKVLAIVRRGHAIPGATTLEADLAQDGRHLVEAVETVPDAVVHLAAAVPRPNELPDSEETAERTRRIDQNVYEAVRHWDAHAIYAGGCSFYVNDNPELKTEASPVAARSPYLKAKLEGERLFLGLDRGASARLSSPFGPGQPRHAVLGRFVTRALAGKPLEVWGNGDREQDFLHVDDVAEFIVQAIEQSAKGAINVAAGEATTMRALAELVSEVAGGAPVHLAAQADPRDGESARFDISKAFEVLNWSPKTNLRDGLKRLVRNDS